MAARRVAIVSDASGDVGSDLGGLARPTPANPAGDPEGRARVEAMVPMGRLGSLDELAHLAAPHVDGTSRFTTGRFVAYAGGWV